MLTPKPQLNLDTAKGYFREHLAVGDYYMDGHIVAGEWRGVGAARLGLRGAVSEDSFIKLCEGLNPETGERLTARMNSTRVEGNRTVSNRRVFYDFTISPPKSVSVVALYQDARIIKIHDEAVRVMVDELERRAETRVRIDGENTERETENITAALFRHETSRELDPHLHTHCILLNATYDSVEDRWKALHASGMYRAQKMAEHLYYHELAKGLRSLGYEIENNARDFEIKGVPAETIARFSKRHQQIDEETKKRIAEEGLRGNEKALREQVAHDKRRRKIKNAVAATLRPKWASEMPPVEHAALNQLKITNYELRIGDGVGVNASAKKPDLPALIAWADAHIFERKSLAADHEVLGAALARGRGENFSLDDLELATVQHGFVIAKDGRTVTNQSILEAELQTSLIAEFNAQKFRPLHHTFVPSDALTPEQHNAVLQMLSSRDLVMLFRGGAGTGKSYTLREVVRGLHEKNHPVFIAAPQHQQADELIRNGLHGACSLAFILHEEIFPRGAVVIVDEAGQIGGKDMLALLKKVQAAEGRLILSGDTRQQGAVAATDALRVIEEHTNIRPICLSEIRRQDPQLGRNRQEREFIKSYRAAVQSAADGNHATAFDQLDQLGCIRECDHETLVRQIAEEYGKTLFQKQRALAVAQRWTEVRELNTAIRDHLKNQGILRKGVKVSSWQSVDLTEAQKRDARYYPAGSRVFFVRDYGRFQRGDWGEVIGADTNSVTLKKDEVVSRVSMAHAERFVMTAQHEVELAKGDRLQMKFNGKSAEGADIRNGELVTVRRVLKDGHIAVRDDTGTSKTLSPTQRLFVPGYAVTSYASQGKTVDVVLAAYTADEHVPITASRNQWYVAISRGRRKALVFTEDKTALRTAVERLGERPPALDIEPDVSTAVETAKAFSPETKRLLEMGAQYQRHLKVQRWVAASQAAHMRPAVAPPPLPSQTITQQPKRGIRI